MKIFKTIMGILLCVFFWGSLMVLWGLVWLNGGLAGVTAWFFIQLLALLAVPFLLGVLIYLAVKRRVNPLVLTLAPALLLALVPILWMFALVQVAYPSNLERTRHEAVTVHSPLTTAARVAWGGDGLAVNYHAFSPQQRWAYDLVVEPAFHGSANLEDYGCYGQTVVAPAAAVVTASHDGEPDETPGKISNVVDAPEGNYVALKLEEGGYLILAHMQPGSLRVKTGDKVKQGDALGLCGNSGNTSEPHVHIHLQREDPDTELSRNGIAEGLPLYFGDANTAMMPKGGFEEVNGTLQPRGDILEPASSLE